MVDLSCKYLGLQLKNPLIVGSSGLTSSIENLKTIAQMGAGAVVLKSIFEEQIKFEADKFIKSDQMLKLNHGMKHFRVLSARRNSIMRKLLNILPVMQKNIP